VEDRGSDFNDDLGLGGGFGLSVLLRDGDEIFRTYFTNLDSSGGIRGWLLVWLMPVRPSGEGVGPSRVAAAASGSTGRRGGGPLAMVGVGSGRQAGAGGSAVRRFQQVRNASAHGQSRLIFNHRRRAWLVSLAGRCQSR
jgi:hypothetical protein